MTLEDPFFVVKDEVFKAINKTRGLYLRWQEVLKYPSSPGSAEIEWISTELRNSLRSIEWDLEDLEDTISIVEKNSSKFKIDSKELCSRRIFIETTRQEVKNIKNIMHRNRNKDVDGASREPLLGNESPPTLATSSWTFAPKYSKLANQNDSPNKSNDCYDSDIQKMQEKMLLNQNDQLEDLSVTVGSLHTVSRQIGMELDEHAVMLDDLNAEMENADSKLDSTLKKVAKVLRISNDRQQWRVILALITVVFLLVILFIVL